MALGDRELDLVLHGASGFVGVLTAQHLATHAPVGTRIGLSGRSETRLAAVRERLGPAAAGWPLLVADAADDDELTALARRTRVVASTVGPYARHGLPLVRACAAVGTHYADLTGEVLFVRRSIDAAHEQARRTGARIVHSCGFDSVPSDLAVLLTHAAVDAAGEGELVEAQLALVSARGGFSGGTVDSLRTQVDEVSADPALAQLLADPYSLSPDRAAEAQLGPQSDLPWPARGEQGWQAPFVMAPHNTRIVRRSNALLGHAYGRRLRYSEVVACGRGPLAPVVAAGLTVGTRALAAGLGFGPTRALLDRVLPDPGQGPDEKARTGGHFRVQLDARTSSGARFRATVAATGDPGYAATAVMLGESALALAGDHAELPTAVLPDAAGVLTPATALGDALACRLREQSFEIVVTRT